MSVIGCKLVEKSTFSFFSFFVWRNELLIVEARIRTNLSKGLLGNGNGCGRRAVKLLQQISARVSR